MNTKRILQVALIIILAVVAWLWLPHLKNPAQQQVNVTDFSSCQLAGGEIQNSEPISCRTADGRTFEEDEQPLPEVVLETPKYGDLVKSPLGVMGKARGTWFFEANIPVTLKDDQGNVLDQQGFHSIGDWMTTDYVPFAGNLTFDPGDAEFGVLIISKDNPSGMPEFDSSFAIPVRFK